MHSYNIMSITLTLIVTTFTVVDIKNNYLQNEALDIMVLWNLFLNDMH